jgi:hypothetical protein
MHFSARGAILKFSKFKGVNFYLGPPSDFFPKNFPVGYTWQ